MAMVSDQASRFATRTHRGWWDERVRIEFRYTIARVRAGHPAEPEWARLEARLLSLCRRAEHGRKVAA